MAASDFQSFFKPFLEIAANGKGHSLKHILKRMTKLPQAREKRVFSSESILRERGTTHYLLIMLLLVSFALFASCGSSSAPKEWKFAYMSDNKWDKKTSAVQYTNLDAVHSMANDMVIQGVSLVLVGGDLIDGRGEDTTGLISQYEAWLQAMSPVYTAQIEVYAVPGNHEYWCDSADSCTSAWEQAMVPTFPPGRTDNPAMPGREFSFVHRNALFIGLDQNQFGPSFPAYYRGNNIDWIEDRLAERDVSLQPHVVVFGHMPQFMTQWGWTRPEDMENREAFWSLLGRAGGHLYFTGHSHVYAVGLASTQDGLVSLYQVIAGSGGAEAETTDWNGEYYEKDRVQPVDWDDNQYLLGYALITIRGKDVSMVWRYVDPASGIFTSRKVFSYRQP